MIISVKEYKGAECLSECNFILKKATFTIGRSPRCDCVIGEELGEWSKGISNIQCTIMKEEENYCLIDGSNEKKSANGIWIEGDRLKEKLDLSPEQEITVYRQGKARIIFTLHQFWQEAPTSDTYNGEVFLIILQDQIVVMQDQIKKLTSAAATYQAKERWQNRSIVQFHGFTKKIIVLVLGLAVAGVLATSTRVYTQAEREDTPALVFRVVKTVGFILAFGIAAIVLLRSEEKEEKDNEPD